MKGLKKVLLIIAAIIMAVVPISADSLNNIGDVVIKEDIAFRRKYVGIETMCADFYITGSRAMIYCSVRTNSNNEYVVLNLYLQYKDGRRWKTIETYYDKDNTNAIINETYNLTKRGSYRLKCVAVTDTGEKATKTFYEEY